MPTEYDQILDRLTRIEILLSTQQQKQYLSVREAAEYLSITPGALYKSISKIKHYKPSGKNIYFDRADLDAYMQTGLVPSDDDISRQAAIYCDNH